MIAKRDYYHQFSFNGNFPELHECIHCLTLSPPSFKCLNWDSIHSSSMIIFSTFIATLTPSRCRLSMQGLRSQPFNEWWISGFSVFAVTRFFQDCINISLALFVDLVSSLSYQRMAKRVWCLCLCFFQFQSHGVPAFCFVFS